MVITRCSALPFAVLALAVSGIVATACEDSTDGVPTEATLRPLASRSSVPGYEQQLAELRRETVAFHEFENAEAAGYDVQFTPCWFYSGVGAMGYHYGQPSLVDATVDLLKPEILIYEPQRGGSLRLVGMEYLVPISAWTGAQPPELVGESFHRNDALGLYALHIWLWRHNPDGMLADWNSKVSCQYAAVAEDRAGQ